MKNRDAKDPTDQRSAIGNYRSSIINPKGFTLVELLVVIAVIALLMAIFIPVLSRARELGQRAVCLSNLRQLTMAWTAYANQHDDRLVDALAFHKVVAGKRLEKYEWQGWAGSAFLFPKSRSALVEDANKGALWPYLRNVDVYRCPRRVVGQALTYAIVSSANGAMVPGTTASNTGLNPPGARVGQTVLRLTRLTDIRSPGASQRAVFLDAGYTTSSDFRVHYLDPKWDVSSPPPINHAGGTTLSMADGHAEYWKWKGRETIALPRKFMAVHPTLNPALLRIVIDGGDYEPKTEAGLQDLQRLQKATWGRLGYPMPEAK